MFPQTQPSGQSQVFFRFPHPGSSCILSKFPCPQWGFITSSQTVIPRKGTVTKCQNKPSPPPHIPQCDT